MHPSNGSQNTDPVDVLIANDMDVMDDMHEESHHRRSSYHHHDDDSRGGNGVDEHNGHERERERGGGSGQYDRHESNSRDVHESRSHYARDNKYDSSTSRQHHRSGASHRSRSRSPVRGGGVNGDVRDRRVYVGNLSYDVKWTHLKDFMRESKS